MGNYTTNTTVISEFPVLPQTTTVSRYTETASLITDKINNAESIINGYLGRRYTVPFSPVPPVVKTMAINLSAHYTFVAKFSSDSHNTNDWVTDLKIDVMAQLEDYRDRKMDIVNTAGTIIAEKNADSRVISNTQGYAPTADLDTVTSWSISSSRLDDIEDGRDSD